MFASIFITVKSIQAEVASGTFTIADVWKNQIFFTLIVSLLSTYILYFVVSFLFFDPWHMFTSFIQYLVLTPTYINILNVYAFCNTHDITWGTKGDDKAEKLPSAKVKADGKVDVAIPTDDQDLNQQYTSELKMIETKAVKEKRVVSANEKQEDYYKGVRSTVVLVWIGCNVALVSVILSTGGNSSLTLAGTEDQNSKATTYLLVVLWSVAGLSAFRFVGAMWFLILRMFRGV
jgi:chitin synthase